jgi:hypothetical protein
LIIRVCSDSNAKEFREAERFFERGILGGASWQASNPSYNTKPETAPKNGTENCRKAIIALKNCRHRGIVSIMLYCYV